jgi:predicted branched-subunit amino acid permease
MGTVAPIVMSAVLFAGSSQFGALAVLAAGGGAGAAIAAGILLNLRYLPMGIALAPSLHGGALRRFLIGQTMIDFAWGVASRGDGRFDPVLMMGVTAPCYPGWVGGTAIGVFAGDLIGDPAALGLDAMFPAFFLCLLVEGELRPGLPRAAAALGSLIALVLIPFTPAGVPVIAACGAALLGLLDRPEPPAAEEPA